MLTARVSSLTRLSAQIQLRRSAKLGLWLSAWVFGVATAVISLVVIAPGFGYDAHAYWLAGRTQQPYAAAPGTLNAYLYSPVFAQLIRPLALLPWPAFLALWMVAETAVFIWLTAPLPLRWRIPVLLACLPEILMGNVYGYLALALVLGVRHPAAWAFPLLTKVSPGGLGLLWLAAGRHWRDLAVAVLVTSAIAACSYALEPDLWREWLRFLVAAGGADSGWTLVRTLAAAVIVVVAARLRQPWLLPLALWVGAPVLGLSSKELAIFAAMPRLWLLRPRRGPAIGVGGATGPV